MPQLAGILEIWSCAASFKDMSPESRDSVSIIFLAEKNSKAKGFNYYIMIFNNCDKKVIIWELQKQSENYTKFRHIHVKSALTKLH